MSHKDDLVEDMHRPKTKVELTERGYEEVCVDCGSRWHQAGSEHCSRTDNPLYDRDNPSTHFRK